MRRLPLFLFAFAAFAQVPADDAAIRQWWRTLNDPELNALIDRCAASNLDLKLAGQRVLEARAARQLSRADLLPSAESSNTVQRERGSFNQGRTSFESNAFQFGFDASWEIDFFGGKRHALDAATAEVRAENESRRDVLISLIAETARNYAELRGAQRELKLTRDNIELQKDSLHLTEVRADAGLGNRLDLERQRTQLETTEALVPQLELRIAREIHALSVLVGQKPAALQAELEALAPLPAPPPEVPAGLPGDLLKRRPDIRAAEAQIDAATAEVGVARADFFPKITLTGAMGRQSPEWTAFTLGAGNFFSFGPGVKLPLFTGGRLKANLAVKKQRYEESLTVYQNTVLRGLRETEDSLSAYTRERERRGRLDAAVHSSQETVRLARDVYVSGLSDFLSVLDAQREQLSVETALAVSDTATLTDLIALYKSLGGGWSE